MSTATPELATLAHLLPAGVLGEVTALRPISMGQSGAAVYAVDSDRGAWILRVSGEADPARWTRQLALLRRVADAGLAPAIVHVDESAHAIVQVRVGGAPLAAALADPAQRQAALVSLVGELRALHALDTAGLDVEARDALAFARAQLAAARARPGFPAWADAAGDVIERAGERLANDPRRALGHNDVNPGNVLWDGTRAWLVDWDVAAPAHPFYDLATLAMFLRLDDEAAHGLLALQERRAIGDDERATFGALRRLAAVMCGLVFLGLVPDLAGLPATPPSLADFYAGLRAGAVDLRRPDGRAAFGLALLQEGLGGAIVGT